MLQTTIVIFHVLYGASILVIALALVPRTGWNVLAFAVSAIAAWAVSGRLGRSRALLFLLVFVALWAEVLVRHRAGILAALGLGVGLGAVAAFLTNPSRGIVEMTRNAPTARLQQVPTLLMFGAGAVVAGAVVFHIRIDPATMLAIVLAPAALSILATIRRPWR